MFDNVLFIFTGDPCFHKPCQSGTCVNLPTSGFRCDCDSGYTGLICDIGKSSF